MIWSYAIPDVAPLSLNHQWVFNMRQKRAFLSKESNALKEILLAYFRLQDKGRGQPKFEYYRMSWAWLLPKMDVAKLTKGVKRVGFFQKNGQLRRNDVSNSFKLPEDTFFDYLGVGYDDRSVISLTGDKRVLAGPKPLLILLVSEAKLSDPLWHGGQEVDLAALVNQVSSRVQT